ncbi:MAG: helix-turn-helix transcriptional regulator [Solirubrobacterales bacterium]|nr:helix-turn-helix transcriptional regulator [Solirubrobacterales bacterium]
MSGQDATQAAGKPDPVSLGSPVGWSVLGLLHREPLWGHEVVARFEEMYGDILPLESSGEIHEALDSLRSRALIEEMDGVEGATRHGPAGTRYRTTSQGSTAYRQWLSSRPREEAQRSRLIMVQLAMLPAHAALEVIDRYEKVCLERAGEASLARQRDGAPSGSSSTSLESRLASEEERLALDARLSWIEFARREFAALASQPPDSD